MRKIFANINPVPEASRLIDSCLNKLNRKTKTIIRRHFAITRIRMFYYKKIKYAAEEFNTRLTNIVSSFPILEDIHPFYADLICVLYDKDNYKIALGKVNATKSKILNVETNSLKMIQHGDTLYRCKCLKRAGLGEMASYVSKLKKELIYLEGVRQHIQRLPTIDPYSRTLIVAGFPNVGKSSYISSITKCKTEVHSYAFTTQSLFVGHFQYSNLNYQIIDTPGILDHMLEDRTKVEMLSITALAHLKSSILFFIDISGTSGFPLQHQIDLYNNLTELLDSKMIVVFSKIDVLIDELDNSGNIKKCYTKELVDFTLEQFINQNENENLKEFVKGKKYIGVTTENLINFKESADIAAELILNERVNSKVKNEEIMKRTISIKPKVKNESSFTDCGSNFLGENRFIKSEDYRDVYVTENKYDDIPEILNGKNISDFLSVESPNEKLKDIEANFIPKELEFDLLTTEEREKHREINMARINANMKSIFSKRSTVNVPICGKFEIDEEKYDRAAMVKVNRNTVVYNKKAQPGISAKVDKTSVKHLYRRVTSSTKKLR